METSSFPNGISWRIPIVINTFSISGAVNILGNIQLGIKSNYEKVAQFYSTNSSLVGTSQTVQY